jgi:carboxyl-terminal processing protease
MKNKIKNFFLSKNFLFVISLIIFGGGAFVGGIFFEYTHKPYFDRITGVSNMQPPFSVNADLEPFWKVWSTIDEKFPDAKDIPAKDRVYGAIKGLVGSLGDPYSVYFPPQDSKDFQDTIDGKFEGVGMEVGIKDKMINVVAPLKNSPAEKAGIKAGDIIVKINDQSTTDMSIDQAVHIMRGKAGTPVTLNIYRSGEKQPRDITIIRAVIEIPTISTKKLPGEIFDITLYNFGTNSTAQFADALEEFQKTGYNKLVIDLRGNPGGYLDSAVDIASMFLPKGQKIVTENFGGSLKDDVYLSKGYGFVDPSKVKILILVDKGSASASEILGGAMQQNKAAVLIGETTYGKGSVQEVIEVTGDTTLKLTIAKWLTPNGTWISKKGLEPDVSVKLSTSTDSKVDEVLNRAVKYFKDGK